MGVILPFLMKLSRFGDWSAAERDRLRALADEYSAQAKGVEVVFGTTDQGDPWCVVKGEDEEILIHVARVGGQFVVHRAADDVLEEGGDLMSALAKLIAPAEQTEPAAEEAAAADPAQPTTLAGRQAYTFIALVAASAFYYESAAVPLPEDLANPETEQAPGEAGAEDVGLSTLLDKIAPELSGRSGDGASPEDPASAVRAQIAALAQEAAAAKAEAEQELAFAGASDGFQDRGDPAPTDSVRSASGLVAEGAGRPPLTGGVGNDVLQGGAEGDVLMGGDGDDVLDGGGVRPGQTDFLYGGAGDDQLRMGQGVVAVGGEGQDLFRVPTPTAASGTALGTILDFDLGDKLGFDTEGVVVLGVTAQTNLSAASGLPVGTPGVPDTPGQRVSLDFNGDGQEDGFLLVTGSKAGALTPGSNPADAMSEEGDLAGEEAYYSFWRLNEPDSGFTLEGGADDVSTQPQAAYADTTFDLI